MASIFKGAEISQIVGTASGLTKVISFDDVQLTKCICQQIQASVQCSINQIYEIGSRNAHRIMGRPSGNGSLNNIMGPTRETVSSLAKLCDVCNPTNLNIKFVSGCTDTGGGLRFKDCVCTSIGATADAGNDTINGSWSLMFTDVEQL